MREELDGGGKSKDPRPSNLSFEALEDRDGARLNVDILGRAVGGGLDRLIEGTSLAADVVRMEVGGAALDGRLRRGATEPDMDMPEFDIVGDGARRGGGEAASARLGRDGKPFAGDAGLDPVARI